MNIRKPAIVGAAALAIISLAVVERDEASARHVLGGDVPRDGAPPCGIFVSTSGVDDSTCGLSPDDPCATINHGIARAQVAALSCVFVQAGTYAEAITLASGVNVVGGFDAAWQSGPYAQAAHQVIIDAPAAAPTFVGVHAVNCTQPTLMSNLIVRGPDAPAAVSGQSSYAIRALNSSGLILADLRLEAGNGAHGSHGANGQNAPNVNAISFMNAGAGGDGDKAPTCDDRSRGAAGPAGTNSCNGGLASNGGAGGLGGTADTDCCGCAPFCICPDFDATAGLIGQPGAQSGGGVGMAGPGGAPCVGGQPGQPGKITNGAAGSGAAGGNIAGGLWLPASGGNGGIGENGGGGGGGGGAGGCDSGIDAYGAGGGGGGAGGCRAPGAGSGGQGGGASVGLLAVNSAVTLSNCDIIRGGGGNGGNGGSGGQGQMHGNGAPGGTTPDGGIGGAGARGGHGGHGGGGGGGAGGLSVGILCGGGSTIAQSNVQVTGGAPGAGGLGGISAPNAPAIINDGNDGSAGAAGALLATSLCTGAAPLAASTCDARPCIAAPCPADIAPLPKGDGVVNVNDLLLVVANWGAAGANPADINGDQVVNVNDLLAVVGAWGVCP